MKAIAIAAVLVAVAAVAGAGAFLLMGGGGDSAVVSGEADASGSIPAAAEARIVDSIEAEKEKGTSIHGSPAGTGWRCGRTWEAAVPDW